MNKKINVMYGLLSLSIFITFFFGIEHFSGGICEYWKCEPYVAILLTVEIISLCFLSLNDLIFETIFNKKEKKI